MRRLNENYKVFNLLGLQTLTTTTSGTGVAITPEMLDDAMIILSVGAVSGTSPTLNVTIQTSDLVGGTYTTVATFGEVTTANKIGSVGASFDGKNSNGEEQKFVRAVATLAGTSPSFLLGISMLVLSEVAKAALNESTPA